jgi:hypothetical protein
VDEGRPRRWTKDDRIGSADSALPALSAKIAARPPAKSNAIVLPLIALVAVGLGVFGDEPFWTAALLTFGALGGFVVVVSLLGIVSEMGWLSGKRVPKALWTNVVDE